MNPKKLAPIILFLLIGLTFLPACGSGMEPIPTETALAPIQKSATSTDAPTEIPTELPTATMEEMVPAEEPTTEPTEEVLTAGDSSACIDCHSDKDMLIDTADPVEEVVSENEGEG